MADIEPWIQLCSAICLSGMNENDQEFLSSDWYRSLLSIVMCYAKDKNHCYTGVYDGRH